MTDLADFNAFDEVWKEYFKVPPARTTIGTSGLLVAGTLVEIDLVGHVPGKGSKREAIKSSNPKPLANYTEAFRAGDLVFAAGQIASDFATGRGAGGAGSIRRFRITARRSRGRPATSSTT